MQEGMLLHSLKYLEYNLYLQQYSWVLKGSLDMEKMQKSWNFVIHKYQSLRSAFEWEDISTPVQVVYNLESVDIKVIDKIQGRK